MKTSRNCCSLREKIQIKFVFFFLLILVSSRLSSQYCSNGLTTGNFCSTTAPYISNVTILNTFLNNTSPCSYTTNSGNYILYAPGPGTSASLIQGLTYTIQITTNASAIESVWIDYNHDFTYSAAEWFQPTIASTPSVMTSFTFAVPMGAVTGTTGLRVRTRAASSLNGAGDACIAFLSGETEDYVVTIMSPQVCSGTPANAIITPDIICPGAQAVLSFSDIAVYPGLNFQWYSSTLQAGSYSAVPGATLSVYNSATTSSSNSTWYLATITCTGSSVTTTLSPVELIANYANPNQNCYCVSTATALQNNEEIFNVMLNGNETNQSFSFSNACYMPAPGPGSQIGKYSNFKTLGSFSNLYAGAANTFSLYQSSCVTSAGNAAAVWIDFNENGSFTDPGEEVYIENALSTGPRNIIGSFIVPAGTSPGVRVMRVTVATGISGAGLSPCLTYGNGETEDYLVTIVGSTSCTGTPSTNIISVSSPSCPINGASLNFIHPSTSYTAAGLTYQWYSSTTQSGSYTAISGATLPVYFTGAMSDSSPIWFKATVTCGNSSATTTLAPRQVSLTLMDCYCPSSAINTFGADVDNFMLNTNLTNPAYSFANGCVNVAPGPGSVLMQYSNFKTLGSLANVYIGGPVNSFSLESRACDNSLNYLSAASIWIDYNKNGSFSDPGETIFAEATTQTGPRSISGTFTVPPGVLTGTTVMRIILGNNTAGSCANVVNGETEDYLINLINSSPCSGAPVVSPVSVSHATVCSGEGSLLSLPVNSYSTTGIEFQWYSSLSQAGPFTVISGATSYSYQAIAPNTDVYYMAAITCTNGLITTSTSVSSVQLWPVLINSIPYIETFEGITNYNQLPNCQWATTSPSLNTLTYLAPTSGGWNQINHTPGGSKFASFKAGSNNNAFFTNAFQLQTGVTYSASVWYISNGLTTWQNLRINLSSSQSLANTTVIATASSPTATIYTQLSGTFTVGNSGIYYLGISNGITAINGFITIDDIELNVPCSLNPVTSINSTSNSVCFGEQVSLSLNAGASPLAISGYTWDNGSQNTAITISPTVTSTYSVWSTSTVNCTGSNLSKITITVNPTPTLTVNSGSVCSANSAFTITPSGGGPGATYSITGGSLVVNPSANSVYSVTGTSAFGCLSANTAVSTITVHATPSLIVSSYSICSGNSVIITALGASTYTWYNGTSSGSNFTVSPNVTTNYSIVGTSLEGCTSGFNSAVTTITVKTTPTISVNSGTLCAGLIYTITANGASTYSLNGNAITGNTFTSSPVTSTGFTITGTSVDGCVSHSAAISQLTVLPIPTITVNNATICSGQSATLNFSGAGSTGVYTVTNGSNVIAPTGTLFVVSPLSPTSYSVTTVNVNGCKNTGVMQIDVNPNPTINVVSSNGSNSLCVGENVNLTANGADTYIWTIQNAAQMNGSSITVSPAVNTSYTVSGTDANGCEGTTSVQQIVMSCTGLSENYFSDKNARVYPNPANEMVVLELNVSGKKIVELNDINGKLIFSQVFFTDKTELNISKLTNGIYHLKVQTRDSVQVIKLVKE